MSTKTNTEDASETSILVLDTGAFISGVVQQLPGIIVTSPLVIREIRSSRAKETVALLKAAARLRVIVPDRKVIREIQKQLQRTQDQSVISPADTEILALAYDFHKKSKKTLLITDDYAIQNIAKILELPYTGYGQKGIREVWKWEIYCPSCFQRYATGRVGDQCRNCGAKVKRRRIK